MGSFFATTTAAAATTTTWLSAVRVLREIRKKVVFMMT